MKVNNGEALKADVLIVLGIGTLTLVSILLFLNNKIAFEKRDLAQPDIEVDEY